MLKGCKKKRKTRYKNIFFFWPMLDSALIFLNGKEVGKDMRQRSPGMGFALVKATLKTEASTHRVPALKPTPHNAP